MAKLAKLRSTNLVPTEVEGVYIEDVPMGKIKEMSKLEEQLHADGDSDGLELMAWLFENVVRAEDGSKFEDALTVEDIEANLGLVQAKEIMNAVMGALVDSGK